MLTRLLSFGDKEMKVGYARSNYQYYARSTILVTLLLLLIAAALQVSELVMD